MRGYSPAETALYEAEAGAPWGSCLDLSLMTGEALEVRGLGASGRASAGAAPVIQDDDLAVALAPSPGGSLRISLHAWNSCLGPLVVTLPPEVAVAVLKPPSARLALRHKPMAVVLSAARNLKEIAA